MSGRESVVLAEVWDGPIVTWVLLPNEHLLCLETGSAITVTSESTGGPWFIEHHSPGFSRELSPAYDDHETVTVAFVNLVSYLSAFLMSDLLGEHRERRLS